MAKSQDMFWTWSRVRFHMQKWYLIHLPLLLLPLTPTSIAY